MIERLIGGQLPSNVCNLVLRGNTQYAFALTGVVLAIGDSSLLFKTKQKEAVIDFAYILKLEPNDRKEL